MTQSSQSIVSFAMLPSKTHHTLAFFSVLFSLLHFSRIALCQRSLINGTPCEIPFTFNSETYTDCFESDGREWCVATDGSFGVCAEEAPEDSSSATTTVDSTTTSSAATTDSTTDCCAELSRLSFSSNLPVLIVDTRGESILDEPKIAASLCTCGGDAGSEAYIGIEIRGSTSARDFMKKSYGVETRDEQDSDLDISVLGFPEGSDWVFYGPEMDKSMGMKNYLTMELTRSGGRYSSRVQYFELFLVDDGDALSMDHYNGLYLLMEKIKRGDERVPIQRLNDEDVSGGYIFKYDNNNFDEGDQIFNSSNSGLAFIVTYPTKSRVETRSLEYLSEYVGEMEEALQTRDRSVWADYIDEESFIDIFLITELTKNPDGYRGSFYFHKEPGSVLSAGPPWDYNEAYGMCCGYPIEGYLNEGVSTGISGGSAISVNGWRYNICLDRDRCVVDPTDGVSWWFRTLMSDATFRSKLQSRWEELRSGPWSTTTIQSYFERIRDEIPDPVRRNADRWNRELAINNDSVTFAQWSDEMSSMESWTVARLEWMDSELSQSTQQRLAGL